MTLSLVLSLSLCSAPAQEPQRPNLVLIVADDLGWRDLGCYGSPNRQTPHLDRLAREGMRFSDAYAAAPNCAPSRACLMTGQYTPRHGIYTVNSSARGKPENRRLVPTKNTTVLPDESRSLAEMLGAAGYESAAIGKWHLGADPKSQGFDHAVAGNKSGHPKSYTSPYKNPDLEDGPQGEYLTDRMTAEAVEFIEQEREAPFFLYLSYFAVHTPIQGRPDLVAAAEARGAARPAYDAMVCAVDEGVGRVRAALEAQGLAGDTLVLFFSDNGGHGRHTSMEPLRGSKGMLYEGGVREPLIAYWPGRVGAGLTSSEPVIGVDFFPTFAELAGASTPDEVPLDGVSLVPLLTGTGSLQPRELYWHFPAYLEAYLPEQGHWRTTPAGSVRDGRWKLLQFFEDGRAELYDLQSDPGETRDLSRAEPERAAALAEKLRAWRLRVGATVPAEREPRYRP